MLLIYHIFIGNTNMERFFSVKRTLCCRDLSVFKSPLQKLAYQFRTIIAGFASKHHADKNSAVAFTAECQAVPGGIGVTGFHAGHAFNLLEQFVAIYDFLPADFGFFCFGILHDLSVFDDPLHKQDQIHAAGFIHFNIVL